MSIQLRILLIVCCILSFYVAIKKIRKSKLQIEYSIFWIVFSILLILIAIFPQITYIFADILGIQSPVNLVYLIIITLLLIKVFFMTIQMSQLEYNLQTLIQKIALDEYEKKREVSQNEKLPKKA